MSKNSTERKEDRRATDGKIATEDLSSTLVGGSGDLTHAEAVAGEDPASVTIDLADVNLEIFDSLREGMTVTTKLGRRIEVLTEKGIAIGRVRSEDTTKVSKLLARNPTAWISNLYHKGIAVRIAVGSGQTA